VNIDDLEERFEAGTEVTPELLIAGGLVKKMKDGIKVLGDGELTKELMYEAIRSSPWRDAANGR